MKRRWRLREGIRHLSEVSSSCGDNRWCTIVAECSGDLSGGEDSPPDIASRSVVHRDCDVQVIVVGTVTRSFKLAAASSWSGTGRSTSSWGSAGRSTSGWSGTGRGTAGATSWLAATWLAAADLGAADLGAAQLWQLEAARLLAATRVAAGVAAAGSWSSTGRSTSGNRSGTGRSTSGRSRTARGTRSGSCTGRGWCTARRSSGATAAAMTMEQAGVGAVDAGETNQRGGNPNVLHLTSPNTIGAGERE